MENISTEFGSFLQYHLQQNKINLIMNNSSNFRIRRTMQRGNEDQKMENSQESLSYYTYVSKRISILRNYQDSSRMKFWCSVVLFKNNRFTKYCRQYYLKRRSKAVEISDRKK